MKKTIILFLALLAGFASVKGQDDEIKLPTVIPPSPEVAALLKFVDIPISQYTGATQMPIAMGTLAKGSIQVPISINYHSSGIRVDEVASRVGLGWALSAGGVVSRTVMGKADEGDLGYFSSDIDEFFLSNGNPNEDFECIESDSDPVAIARFEKLKRLATGQSDAEPDLFNYSLPNGKSGKFLFDRNRVIHKFEENDIKIENPFSNSLQSPTSWKIIDSDGTVYLFDKIEHSYSSSFCDDGGTSGGVSGSSEHAVTSWHLTQITSADGNHTVTFTYTVESQEYNTSISNTEYRYIDTPSEGYRRNNTVCYQKMLSLTPVLTAINTSWGQSAHFIAGTQQRKDIGGTAYPLESIEIKNNAYLVKKFNLQQSYFQAKKEGTALNQNKPENSRLKLDAVQEVDLSGNTQPPYTFEYAEGQDFPARLSYSQDTKGYFNNADNHTLVSWDDHELQYIVGADRSPNLAANKLGALIKVTYPTGGEANYVYSLHQVAIPSTPIRTKVSEYIEASFGETEQYTITINSPNGSSFLLTDYYNPTSGGTSGISADVELSVTGNGESEYFFGQSNSITSPHIIELPNGTYTIRASISNRSNLQGQTAWLKLTWYSYGANTNNKWVGGLRVVETQLKDATGNTIHNFYKYISEANPEISSGGDFALLKSTQTRWQNDGRIVRGQCLIENRWSYTELKSTPMIPMGLSMSSSVSYSRVERLIGKGMKTELGSGGTSGKSVSYFYNLTIPQGYPDPDSWSEPSFIPTQSHPLMGKVLKEEQYEYLGSTMVAPLEYENEYRLKAKTEYTYSQYGNPKNIYAVKMDVAESSGCSSCPAFKFNKYYYWHITDSRYDIASTKNYIYDNDGNEMLTESTNTYNSYLQLQSTESRNSDNRLLSTTYTYPHQLASAGNIYQAMKDKNMIAMPVKVNMVSDAVTLSTQRTEYDLFGTSILPKTIYTERGGAAEESRLQYYSYDSKGNPLEFSKEDDPHVSIIWDNLQLRPIAKAVNASHNQIWHTSFEEDGDIDGGWTGNKAQYNYILTDLNLPSGDYILSYWKRTGGGWTIEEEVLSSSQINGKFLSGTIDEVRIFPKGAQMSTVTYDVAGRKLTECDANGHVIRYEYDGFGRLLAARDEYGNLLKAYDYKYHNE